MDTYNRRVTSTKTKDVQQQELSRPLQNTSFTGDEESIVRYPFMTGRTEDFDSRSKSYVNEWRKGTGVTKMNEGQRTLVSNYLTCVNLGIESITSISQVEFFLTLGINIRQSNSLH